MLIPIRFIYVSAQAGMTCGQIENINGEIKLYADTNIESQNSSPDWGSVKLTANSGRSSSNQACALTLNSLQAEAAEIKYEDC